MNRPLAVILSTLALMMFLLIPAYASFSKIVNDPRNDVQGMNGNVDMPDIDIQKVTYYQYNDGRAVVSIVVYGKINQNSVYSFYINTSRNGKRVMYDIVYTQNPYLSDNGTETKAIEVTYGENSHEINGSFDINGNTIRVSFHLLNSDEKLLDLETLTLHMDYSSNQITSFGTDYAAYHSEETQQSSYNQTSNPENQNNNKKKSPGFEVLLLLLAISLTILFRKKKL